MFPTQDNLKVLYIAERANHHGALPRALAEQSVTAELRLVSDAAELRTALYDGIWHFGVVNWPVGDQELQNCLSVAASAPAGPLFLALADELTGDAPEAARASGMCDVILWEELPARLKALLPEIKMRRDASPPAQLTQEQQSKELSVLYGVAKAAFESKSEDELFERITGLIMESFHPDHFGVMLLDRETDSLYLHPSFRGHFPQLASWRNEVGVGVTGIVAQTGQLINLPDVRKSPIYLAFDEFIRSELCVPIFVKKELIGVINAESTQQHAFSSDDERLLVTLAGQLGIAVERLRMERDLRKHVAQLAAIHDASQEIAAASLDAETVYKAIHSATSRLLEFDAFAIVRWEQARHEVEAVYLIDDGQRFPPRRSKDDKGWSSYVLRTGASLRINDFMSEKKIMPQPIHYGSNRHARSVLVVPLKLGGRIVGTFSVQSYSPNQYTADDLQMLELMAGHAAIALENSRLYEEVSRQALTFANMFDAIIITDGQSIITDWNPAAETMFGYTRNEAIGQPVIFLYPPDPKGSMEEVIFQSLYDDGRWEGETTVLHKDGTPRIADLIVLPVFGSGGQLIATVGVNRDITQRKKAEEAVRISEARLAGIIDSAMDGIVTMDHEGKIFLFNRAAEEIFLCKAEEVIGKPVEILLPEGMYAAHRKSMADFHVEPGEGRVMSNSMPYVTARRANGETFPAEVTISQVSVEGQRYLTATVRDASERLRAQLEMSRLAGVIEQAAESVVLTDHLARIVYVNPFFLKVTGYSTEDVYGKSIRIFMSDYHDHDFYRDVFKTVGSGLPWTGVIVSRRKDGSLLHELATLFPIKDNSGAVVNYVGVKRDISEEVQREREMQAIMLVSTALRKALTRAEMMPIILDQLMELLSGVGAMIAMYDENRKELYIELGRGVLSEASYQWISCDVGISGLVFHSGAPFQTDDLAALPGIKPLFDIGEINAVVGAPLAVQGEVIGALWIGRAMPFTDSEFHVLQAVADMSANAIHRASLHERTIHYAEQTLAITAAGRLMAEILNPEDIYSHLSQSVNSLIGEVGMLSIYVLEASEWVCRCVYSICNGHLQDVRQVEPVSLGEVASGPLAQAVNEHKPVILRDLSESVSDLTCLHYDPPDHASAVIVPLVARGKVLGMIQLVSPTPNRFTDEDVDLLSLIGSTAATAIENADLYQGLQETNQELLRAYDSTIEGWSRVLDLRDRETESHTQRVTELTLQIAHKLGLSEEKLVHIRRGALLHDIGKMAVPDRILHKPDTLTSEEWTVMRMHPVYAYEMLSPIAYLRPALSIPYCHHEWWDGSGYPRGLKGEEIPLEARIFAIVDVYDALTSTRPYRAAWPHTQALRHMVSEAGTHFDPVLVEEFLRILPPTDA